MEQFGLPCLDGQSIAWATSRTQLQGITSALVFQGQGVKGTENGFATTEGKVSWSSSTSMKSYGQDFTRREPQALRRRLLPGGQVRG